MGHHHHHGHHVHNAAGTTTYHTITTSSSHHHHGNSSSSGPSFRFSVGSVFGLICAILIVGAIVGAIALVCSSGACHSSSSADDDDYSWDDHHWPHLTASELRTNSIASDALLINMQVVAAAGTFGILTIYHLLKHLEENEIFYWPMFFFYCVTYYLFSLAKYIQFGDFLSSSNTNAGSDDGDRHVAGMVLAYFAIITIWIGIIVIRRRQMRLLDITASFGQNRATLLFAVAALLVAIGSGLRMAQVSHEFNNGTREPLGFVTGDIMILVLAATSMLLNSREAMVVACFAAGYEGVYSIATIFEVRTNPGDWTRDSSEAWMALAGAIIASLGILVFFALSRSLSAGLATAESSRLLGQVAKAKAKPTFATYVSISMCCVLLLAGAIIIIQGVITGDFTNSNWHDRVTVYIDLGSLPLLALFAFSYVSAASSDSEGERPVLRMCVLFGMIARLFLDSGVNVTALQAAFLTNASGSVAIGLATLYAAFGTIIIVLMVPLSSAPPVKPVYSLLITDMFLTVFGCGIIRGSTDTGFTALAPVSGITATITGVVVLSSLWCYRPELSLAVCATVGCLIFQLIVQTDEVVTNLDRFEEASTVDKVYAGLGASLCCIAMLFNLVLALRMYRTWLREGTSALGSTFLVNW
eukprot:m.20044 g.20044  ORF g.20044 m.20044 type:complete len:642 (+) comp3494_c0_seq1:69-1994(+)